MTELMQSDRNCNAEDNENNSGQVPKGFAHKTNLLHATDQACWTIHILGKLTGLSNLSIGSIPCPLLSSQDTF